MIIYLTCHPPKNMLPFWKCQQINHNSELSESFHLQSCKYHKRGGIYMDFSCEHSKYDLLADLVVDCTPVATPIRVSQAHGPTIPHQQPTVVPRPWASYHAKGQLYPRTALSVLLGTNIQWAQLTICLHLTAQLHIQKVTTVQGEQNKWHQLSAAWALHLAAGSGGGVGQVPPAECHHK